MGVGEWRPHARVVSAPGRSEGLRGLTPALHTGAGTAAGATEHSGVFSTRLSRHQKAALPLTLPGTPQPRARLSCQSVEKPQPLEERERPGWRN